MGLNKEQQRLAESDVLGTSLIRGIAGSGKTTVGIHRLHYLLDKYCGIDEEVLFVTYNKSLTEYLKHLYQEIEKYENLSLFDDGSHADKVEFRTIDSLMYHAFKAYCEQHQYKLKIEWQTPYELWYEAITTIAKQYPEAKVLVRDNQKFLQDEIRWIKGCDYAKLEIYQNVDRIGRGSNSGEGPTRLNKNSVNREGIFALMVEVDNLLLKAYKVDLGTANLLALRYMMGQKSDKSYKHIIVDEAQDLTKVQLKFLACIQDKGDNSSVLFLMDVAQSIYSQAWLGKGHAFTTIGYDMTGKGSKLSKNYRTTTEISKCAYSLLSKEASIVEDHHFVKPSLLDRHGDYPIYRRFETNQMQNNYVVKQIKQLVKSGYRLGEIAVVSKINKNLEIIQKVLLDHQIDTMLFNKKSPVDFGVDKVKLLTMHAVKGLEFKVVILIDLNSGIIPYVQPNWSDEQKALEEITERKLLYVGMTRAKEKLFMCSYGEASKFIQDIDKSFLIMQTGCRMGAYYTLPYEAYNFRSQLEQETSEEESVRQWMINELMTSYGYPKELLQIEYKVKTFSQTGKVDIVVINGRTGKPYICVETKKRGIEIQEAIAQLRSYMQVSGAKFGIATNGTNIAFIDNQGNYITDLPKCSIQVLPSSTQNYEVVNPHNHKTQEFEWDMSACELIMNGEVLEKDAVTILQVYSDIAAGVPIEMIDETKGKFMIPTPILEGKKDVFMLQVKGDSMIDAGINNEDYVVIQPVPHVENKQIAAIEYNGGVTLKRLMRMGDTVLLISENDAYEPINISEGELRVIGKLVAIVKAY